MCYHLSWYCVFCSGREKRNLTILSLLSKKSNAGITKLTVFLSAPFALFTFTVYSTIFFFLSCICLKRRQARKLGSWKNVTRKNTLMKSKCYPQEQKVVWCKINLYHVLIQFGFPNSIYQFIVYVELSLYGKIKCSHHLYLISCHF